MSKREDGILDRIDDALRATRLPQDVGYLGGHSVFHRVGETRQNDGTRYLVWNDLWLFGYHYGHSTDCVRIITPDVHIRIYDREGKPYALEYGACCRPGPWWELLETLPALLRRESETCAAIVAGVERERREVKLRAEEATLNRWLDRRRSAPDARVSLDARKAALLSRADAAQALDIRRALTHAEIDAIEPELRPAPTPKLPDLGPSVRTPTVSR